MIDVITRGALGELGSLLLDFYIHNAIWINAIIGIYAILVVWAHQGYLKVGERIKEVLLKIYGDSLRNKNEAWFAKTLPHSELDFDIIAAQIRVPFIAPRKSIWIRFNNSKTIRKLFTPEVIKELFSTDHS